VGDVPVVDGSFLDLVTSDERNVLLQWRPRPHGITLFGRSQYVNKLTRSFEKSIDEIVSRHIDRSPFFGRCAKTLLNDRRPEPVSLDEVLDDIVNVPAGAAVNRPVEDFGRSQCNTLAMFLNGVGVTINRERHAAYVNCTASVEQCETAIWYVKNVSITLSQCDGYFAIDAEDQRGRNSLPAGTWPRRGFSVAALSKTTRTQIDEYLLVKGATWLRRACI
jgi:hypothetical protein